MTTTWTAGVVAHGIGGKPSTHRTRPDLCPGMGHPSVTYHPQMDRTWCLCGERVESGNAIPDGPHIACCGGPLAEATQSEFDVRDLHVIQKEKT